MIIFGREPHKAHPRLKFEKSLKQERNILIVRIGYVNMKTNSNDARKGRNVKSKNPRQRYFTECGTLVWRGMKKETSAQSVIREIVA